MAWFLCFEHYFSLKLGSSQQGRMAESGKEWQLLLCFLHQQAGSLPLAPHKKPVKGRINLQMIVPVDGESCPLTPSFQVPVILGPFSSLLSIATAQLLWSSEEPLGRGVLWNPELMWAKSEMLPLPSDCPQGQCEVRGTPQTTKEGSPSCMSIQIHSCKDGVCLNQTRTYCG